MNRKFQSSLVIANVANIATGVIKEIAGNDISNSLNGSKVTTEVLESLVYQRLNSRFAEAKNSIN